MSSSPHPLPLPQEVIEIIFSYLSQSTLRCCARLVCKEWNLICLKYALWRTGVWSADLDGQRVGRLLKRLRRLDSLAIWVRCDPTLTDHKELVLTTEEEEREQVQTFETFRRGILEQLSRFQPQRSGGRDDDTRNTHFGSLVDKRRVLRLHPFGNLKELSFHGYGIEHDLYLGPLLPAMTHLQKLKLEIWDRQDVFFLRLLRACPVLEDLEIFGRKKESLRIWIQEDNEEERSSVRSPLSRHPLKRLYLRRVTIRQGSIERLITMLGELIAFRIVDFNRPWWSEPADFHCEMVDCSILQNLIKVHMFPREKSAKIEALLLVPYHERIAHQYYVLSERQYPRWLPDIQVIHMPTAWLEDYWYGIGSCAEVPTLEVIGQGRHYTENGVVDNSGVERYLIQNRELKHVRAPESVIPTGRLVDVYMSDSFKKAVQDRDSALATRAAEEAVQAAAAKLEAIRLASCATEGDKSRSGTMGKKKPDPPPIPPEPIRLQHDHTWTCEGLLTLKLGLVPKRRAFAKTAAEFAAAATGPHIMTLNEELARTYAYIATVCPNLRTVEFYHPAMQFGGRGAISQDEAIAQLDEEDRFHPLKQLTRLKNLETLTLRLHTIEGHIEFEDFEWMMETTVKEGSSSDNTEVACWPKLESFQIRYHTSAKDENYQYWMALVQELRPGLDVRVRQDLLIPWYSYR